MTPRLILVVDDDNDTRIILRALLERHGYDVAEAANARQAMDAVRQGVGLVIMNHPVMVAPQLSLARWLRAQAGTRDVPIINLTSRAVPNFIEEAATQGITVSLVKPIDVHAILELVQQLNAPLAAR